LIAKGKVSKSWVKHNKLFSKPMRAGQTGVDESTKVYVILQPAQPGDIGGLPAHGHYHKSNRCKHLSTFSTKEITVGEAISQGKTMCPDCFR